MLTSQDYKRFQKHILLPEIGVAGQQKLKNAKVLVVGAGGLGCPVLLYLAAAGIGHLGIVDDDTVDLSNLQRQVIYQSNDVGKKKAVIATERIVAHNSEIKVDTYTEKLSRQNAQKIIENYEIVVDCTDNFAVRYLINDICVLQNKAFVYGAIHRFEGQVSVFNYTDTTGQLGPSYRCIFPEKPMALEIPNCVEVGVLGILPGSIGLYQANEVIKMITGIGQVLSGQLLMIDLLTNNQQKIKIKRSTNASTLVDQRNIDPQKYDYEDIDQVNLELLQKEEPTLFILDVRNIDEHERYHLEHSNLIPIADLSNRLSEIPNNTSIVVYCQSGKRSLAAIDILLDAGKNLKIYNLAGGLNACN